LKSSSTMKLWVTSLSCSAQLSSQTQFTFFIPQRIFLSPPKTNLILRLRLGAFSLRKAKVSRPFPSSSTLKHSEAVRYQTVCSFLGRVGTGDDPKKKSVKPSPLSQSKNYFMNHVHAILSAAPNSSATKVLRLSGEWTAAEKGEARGSHNWHLISFHTKME
jgi:hypothetical protein